MEETLAHSLQEEKEVKEIEEQEHFLLKVRMKLKFEYVGEKKEGKKENKFVEKSDFLTTGLPGCPVLASQWHTIIDKKRAKRMMMKVELTFGIFEEL